MRHKLVWALAWISAWLLLTVAAAVALGTAELQRLRERFEADARVVHRLLSLRAVEHETILATLALLDVPGADAAAQRLPAIYPRVLAVLRREGNLPWGDAARAEALASAEAASRRAGRAWGLVSELGEGRLWVVQASDQASHALRIDLAGMVRAAEWPFAGMDAVRVELSHAGHRWVIQPGAAEQGGWRFQFDKPLTVRSQPFDVVAERRVGWSELPWAYMGAAAALIGGVLVGAALLQQQRVARRRAEELLRLGQRGRLNAMGEVAAGMAHELNQPLTAILASTRAAERLLRDDPADVDAARGAMKAAGEQARRAADVLSRLRRIMERPGGADRIEAVDLRAAVDGALHLVEPQLRRLRIQVRVQGQGTPIVMADPVALDQIIHNLLGNALHALEQVPEPERRLSLTAGAEARDGWLLVADSGPGIPPALRARVFDPFFTTREGGLGLGLSLCETLAAGMDGRLELAAAGDPRRVAAGMPGAAFILSLPLRHQP